jgi:hypothetical protein
MEWTNHLADLYPYLEMPPFALIMTVDTTMSTPPAIWNPPSLVPSRRTVAATALSGSKTDRMLALDGLICLRLPIYSMKGNAVPSKMTKITSETETASMLKPERLHG